jgi:hypothetical protein
MVRATIAVWGIAMAWQNDLRLELGGSGERSLEVINLEPQQDPIAMGQCWVPDGAVVVGTVPAMKLKNEATAQDKPLVVGPAMGALASQQSLVPPAARFYIADANQGLWIHGSFVA